MQEITDVDDTIMFNIINRTIVPNNVFDIVVQGDNNSRNIKYRIQRNFENVDLSSKSISIRYTTPDNKSDESFAKNLISEIDYITFEWNLSAGVTAESGIITYDILFYDNDGYKWHTKPATLNVEKGLKTTTIKPQPTTDWINSWRSEAGQILTECRSADASAQQAIKALDDVESTKNIVLQKAKESSDSAVNAKFEADRAKTEADKIVSIAQFSGKYEDLSEKPSFNGVEIKPGDNSYSNLGIQPAGEYATLSEQTALNEKIEGIENFYMSKELYDPNGSGVVTRAVVANNALSAESVDWNDVKNKQAKYIPDIHNHSDYETQISALQEKNDTFSTELTSLKSNKAPLASPNFTGTPKIAGKEIPTTESGIWAPKLIGSITAGNPTYPFEPIGLWEIIGNRMFIFCKMAVDSNNIGGMKGYILVGGLPDIPSKTIQYIPCFFHYLKPEFKNVLPLITARAGQNKLELMFDDITTSFVTLSTEHLNTTGNEFLVTFNLDFPID